MCVHKLKSRGFKYSDCGVKRIWAKSSCWRTTSPLQSLSYIPTLCPFGTRNLISLVIFLAHEWTFFSNTLLLKVEVAGSPVQTKPNASSPLFDTMTPSIMIEAGWLDVDTLRCSETSLSIVTTRSFCLLKTGWTGKAFSSKKMRLLFSWLFRSSSAPLQALLNHCCTQEVFSGTSQTFTPIFLPSWIQRRLKFSSSVLVLSFSGMSRSLLSIKSRLAYLMTSWFIIWGFSDREGSFVWTQAFKRCAIRWTVILFWNFSFLEART